MLDFRKVLLGLSVAGLGLVGTASAQISCPGTAAVTKTVRAEGITESLPNITAGACTGTTNTATITFTVTTNAPITNLLLTGTTTNSTDAQATAAGLGPVAQGVLVNATTMQFTISPVPAAPTAVTGITISNLRVNASALPVGSAVTALISSGTGLFISSATPAQAAFTQTSLAATTFTGFANVAICTSNTTTVSPVGSVKISENFNSAFTTAGEEAAFEPPATGIPTVLLGTVIGTHIAVTFGNLVAGVNYYVPVSVVSGNLTLTAVPAANSPDTAALAGGSIGPAATPTLGVTQVAVTGGTGTVFYSVTHDSTSIDSTGSVGVAPAPAIDGTQIVLYEVLGSSTVGGVTTPPTVSASVVGNTASGYPQFAAAVSPTAVSAKNPTTTPPTTNSQGILSSCSTTMIFPYLLNTGGYDTGIALTNAGLGSSVSGNTVTPTTTGSCTLTLWGSATLNGTALTPFSLPAITVAAGQVYAFTLSSALMAMTTPPAGFAGYGIALCNFQGGHGFAFLADGFGTSPGKGLSQGYLAPIISDVFNNIAQAVQEPL